MKFNSEELNGGLFIAEKILSAKKWNWAGIFIAALGLTAYQFAFFSAVRLTGVAIGTMVAIGSAPVLAGIFGKFFLKNVSLPDGSYQPCLQ